MLVLATACTPVNLTPPPAAAPAPVVALSGASLLIGAGDIHSCHSAMSIRTAALVDSVLRADSIAGVDAVVFSLGDNAHTAVTAAQFANCFERGWGDPTRRIIKKLRPTPGNHDYYTPGAASYYEYFGAAAGPAGKGYYSYDIGTWHVVVVNSEIIVNPRFADAARQEQMVWVEQDLQAHRTLCTIAYWHHPRFSSGWHGSDPKLVPLWQLLYDNDVDLVLSGHDHGYERFLPMTPMGAADSAKGVTAIVAGTGGGTLRGFSKRRHPGSAYQVEGRSGVLLLTLGGGAFRSAFLEVGGRVWDPSGGLCH